jgi:BMFP domain-containing protein YqiC
MTLDIIDREEFDRRLELSTDRMRQQRLVLEAWAAELEDLIVRYACVLDRINANSE